MTKSIAPYWNPLDPMNVGLWSQVDGMETILEEMILSRDEETGEQTKLTRIFPDTDTIRFGSMVHDYPEEIFVVRGRLYDGAADMWLEQGHYVSRPPGEVHGPFRTDVGCILLEVSRPAPA